jgi:hypothetical protein
MTRFTNLSIAADIRRKRTWRRILVRMMIVLAVLSLGVLGAAVWAARALPGLAAAAVGRLTNCQVEMGAFDFRLDGSVLIDGLVLRPRQRQPPYDNAILRAKSVYTRFARGSLLRLAPRLTEVRVQDFLLDAQWNLDTGGWNLGALRFDIPKGSGKVLPSIHLQGGRLRYGKVSGHNVEIVTSMPVEAHFERDGQTPGTYRFDIKTSTLSGGHGDSRLTGSWRPGELTLAGGLSSTDIPSLARVWAVDVLAGELKYDRSGAYTLDLRLKDVHGKQVPEVDALQYIVPAPTGGEGPAANLQKFFARYRPTGLVESITLRAAGHFRKLSESEITGQLVCRDVSICDVKFPYEVNHLTGTLDFSQSMMLVNRLSGTHGDVDIVIEGWTKGSGDARQYQCRVTTDNMILDEALYTALQPGHKRMWDAFGPSGIVAADYRLIRTSPADKGMTLSVDLKGVSAAYRPFPYPLTGLTGRLRFDRENITVENVVSQAGGHHIRLNGRVTDRGTDTPAYAISIDATDIPLDATLAEALPSQHRAWYRHFEPRGTADIRARVFGTRAADSAGPVSFLADLSCRQGSLKMGQMPLRLTAVTAEVAIAPDSLAIKELRGDCDGSPISVTGGVHCSRSGELQDYRLQVTAAAAPLNEKTLGLLPLPLAQQVAAFRPEGKVNVAVELKKTDSNEPPARRMVIECLGNKVNHQRFAFPLEDVRGTITATNDVVTLKGVTARPAGAEVSQRTSGVRIDGTVHLEQGAFTEGSFAGAARAVPLPPEWADALPKSLASAYRDLSLQGPVDLDVTALRISPAGEKERLVEFAGQADFQSCHMNLAGAGTELCGTLSGEGAYRTHHGFSCGRLQLEAEQLVVRGKPITNLRIDARCDPNTQKWSAADFTGDCCGGKLLGGLEVTKIEGAPLQYRLQAAFRRINLEPFLLAGKTGAAAERRYSGGTMDALLSLEARAGDRSSRRGACQIDIADMQVGKVSPLGNVLSVLSLNEPTDYTFERMLIDSFIKGEKLLIRTLDMSGRNVAFAGSGSMDLPSEELNLTLTAHGRRNQATEPSVLQSLTEGLGGGVVRMRITGRMANPRVEAKVLPVIEDSLSIFGTPKDSGADTR